jgi:beta-fructofuranosidase
MMEKKNFAMTAILIHTFFFIGCGKERGSAQQTDFQQVIEVGEFKRIYNPSAELEKQWHINDHCFVHGEDRTWHLFGITDEKPAPPAPYSDSPQTVFWAHATAKTLLQEQWQKEPFPMTIDASIGEVHLWAPHIILHDGLYYMYYCAGDPDHTRYKIHLATSQNLYDWQRHPANPLVVDGYDARDPFILRLKDQWVMYYTATGKPEGGNHTVAAVTSTDLIHWSGKRVVYTDPEVGTWGGPTESPFVVRRGPYYYLFIGPGADYITTKVYRSEDPYAWTTDQEAAVIKSHAAEIVRDADGRWYISHCGLYQEGVYLAPLRWHDGINDKNSSIPIPR